MSEYANFQRTCHCGGTGQFPDLPHTRNCPLRRLQSDFERTRHATDRWQEGISLPFHRGPQIAPPHLYNMRERMQISDLGTDDRYRWWGYGPSMAQDHQARYHQSLQDPRYPNGHGPGGVQRSWGWGPG